MIIPKTERIIPKPRSEVENVAITLEYLTSFMVWTEKLSDKEIESLSARVEDLIYPSNAQGMNNFFEDCVKYLSSQLDTSPDIDFDGAGVYISPLDLNKRNNETKS